MARFRERSGVALPLAFAGAILVPCMVLVFFGARAIGLEARFADTRREERLRGTAEILNRLVDSEMERLREGATRALWPFREPAFETREAEQAVLEFARDERIACGVIFAGDGRIVGPPVPLVRPPRRSGEGGGISPAAIAAREGETPEAAHLRLLRKMGQLQRLPGQKAGCRFIVNHEDKEAFTG